MFSNKSRPAKIIYVEFVWICYTDDPGLSPTSVGKFAQGNLLPLWGNPAREFGRTPLLIHGYQVETQRGLAAETGLRLGEMCS